MAFGVVGLEGGNRNEDKRRNLIRRLLPLKPKKSKVTTPQLVLLYLVPKLLKYISRSLNL